MAPKKDANGRLRSTVYFQGKRYTVRAKNNRELTRKKRDMLARLEAGSMIVSETTTVEEWAKRWLDTYCKDSMGAGCYQNYAGVIRNQIVPAIGSMRVKDVKAVHCQMILNAQKGRSTSFLSKIKSVLRRMFDRARKEHLIAENPATDLEMPTTNDGSYRSITPEERKEILILAETHKSGLLIKMLLYCGLRPGECIPLQWTDIDLQTGFVTIRKALKKGSEIVEEPKTYAGMRKVPIPAIFLQDLKTAYTGNPFDYVFKQPTTGRMHTRSSLRCAWNSFKRALDIQMGAKVYRNQIIVHAVADDLCPYCLRHTYGTDLQDAEVPINVAKYLMGHSDISVTANIYTETTDTAIEIARQKVDSHLCMSKGMSHDKRAAGNS